MKWILFIRLPLYISLLLYACVSVVHTLFFFRVHWRGVGWRGEGVLGWCVFFCCFPFSRATAQKDAVSFPNCKYVKSHDISLYHIYNTHIDMRRTSKSNGNTLRTQAQTHTHTHWHIKCVPVDLVVVCCVKFSTLAVLVCASHGHSNIIRSLGEDMWTLCNIMYPPKTCTTTHVI